MDPAQSALFIIIIVLTILLVVLGFQVFLVLKELRKTLDKLNKVLDDAGVISESVSRPISSLSSLTQGLKLGAIIAKVVNGKKGKKDE